MGDLKDAVRPRHDPPVKAEFYAYKLAVACRFGWHQWKYGERVGLVTQRRRCMRCGKESDTLA